MNKQEALTILESCPVEYRNEDNFITLWKTYKKFVWCNTVNEALEELNKLNNRNKHIAMEIDSYDDKFMSELKDWSCSLE